MHADSRPIEDLGTPGRKVIDKARLAKLREEVGELMGWPKGFPGSQPVSFARKHLQTLREQHYYVCEKSDGLRYLLYMTIEEYMSPQGKIEHEEVHYLIDRKNDFWELYQRNLHVPTVRGDDTFHDRTILDGELVMDDEPNGRKQPRYLIFDCPVIDGESKRQRSLDKRLAYLADHIIKPYKDLFTRFASERDHQAFLLDMKNMQFSYGIEMMFRKILPELRHGNDGLIFTRLHSPYKSGTDPNILKWKPKEENTVDFRLRLEFPVVTVDGGPSDRFVDYESVPLVTLMVGHGRDGHKPLRPPTPLSNNLYLTEEEWEKLKSLGDPLNDRVAECGLDDQGRWRLHRFRDDKQNANHVDVVVSVLESISDGVTEKDLLDAAKSIKDNWKRREKENQAQQAQARREEHRPA